MRLLKINKQIIYSHPKVSKLAGPVPRTFKEICAVSKISKKEIGRCFKLTLKALSTSVELITTADFMSRFCTNLDLPNSVQRAATHIARKAVEMDIVPGRSPISVAAAAIYMSSQVLINETFKLQQITLKIISGFRSEENAQGNWGHSWSS